MAVPGTDEHLVQALREKFEGRPTIGFARTCKLLNINAKALRRHVRCGNIRFRQTGFGKCRVRREFALQDLVDFYAGARRRQEPAGQSNVTRVHRGSQASFLDGYVARRARRADRRDQRRRLTGKDT